MSELGKRLMAHRAARDARWIALGKWGRFKFRCRDQFAKWKYRVCRAWEVLREGDDDETYRRPFF